jgi:hypothetical protein
MKALISVRTTANCADEFDRARLASVSNNAASLERSRGTTRDLDQGSPHPPMRGAGPRLRQLARGLAWLTKYSED